MATTAKSFNFTISPDFNPGYLAGWYIFNTWLQRQSGEAFHLELYDSFDSQRRAIAEDKFDLIYANPFDASMLVREKGFVPLAAPADKADEAIIAMARDSAVQTVEELAPGLMISATRDPEVNMMGMIMLEPADLHRDNTVFKYCDSYVLVAKDLIRGAADIGFFLAETYHELSGVVRAQLRPLVQSRIQVIHHVLLAGPGLEHRHREIQQALLEMGATAQGRALLQSLNISGWARVEPEDTEFMIDLMETLQT